MDLRASICTLRMQMWAKSRLRRAEWRTVAGSDCVHCIRSVKENQVAQGTVKAGVLEPQMIPGIRVQVSWVSQFRKRNWMGLQLTFIASHSSCRLFENLVKDAEPKWGRVKQDVLVRLNGVENGSWPGCLTPTHTYAHTLSFQARIPGDTFFLAGMESGLQNPSQYKPLGGSLTRQSSPGPFLF